MADFWHLAGWALIGVSVALFAHGFNFSFGRPTVNNYHSHYASCDCACHEQHEDEDEEDEEYEITLRHCSCEEENND